MSEVQTTEKKVYLGDGIEFKTFEAAEAFVDANKIGRTVAGLKTKLKEARKQQQKLCPHPVEKVKQVNTFRSGAHQFDDGEVDWESVKCECCGYKWDRHQK